MFTFLNSFIHKSQAFDSIVFFLAVQLPYIVIAAAGLFLLLYKTAHDNVVWIKGLPRRIAKCVHVGFAVGIAYGITAILKRVIHHARPFEGKDGITPLFQHSGGDSFPSGHATAFAAIATIIYFHNKTAGIFFWIAAILISVSRVVAGVHYPIDIAAGICIGAGVGVIMNKVWRKIAKATTY